MQRFSPTAPQMLVALMLSLTIATPSLARIPRALYSPVQKEQKSTVTQETNNQPTVPKQAKAAAKADNSGKQSTQKDHHHYDDADHHSDQHAPLTEHDQHHKAPPEMDARVTPVPVDPTRFAPDPTFDTPYNVEEQLEIYGGKTRFDMPRPLIEWGYPQYAEGPIGAGHNLIGSKNLVRPQLLAYGDVRTAVAYNNNGNTEIAQVATRFNLDIDLKLTATERLHAFLRPLDNEKEGFTRYEFGGSDANKNNDGVKTDLDVETLFFEGDIASLHSGFSGNYAQYDLPFAVGLFPLFLQNGVWLNDAFTGFALTLPARNSPLLDITNFDITVFAGFDDVTSTAFLNAANKADNSVADLFGITTFMDVNEGYLEAGYAYLKDTNNDGNDLSYHNATIGWTSRYQNHLSYSVRVIGNFGQDPAPGQAKTADGYALLFESSFITSKPYTVVPYLNLFVGVDRPQAVARGNKGLLENTGINFETDNLTGFPTLDDSANDTWGMALGLQHLFSLNQQLVVELATVQIQGATNSPNRIAKDDQYALGVRYQKPLNKRWIFRTDAIYGWLQNDRDISGVRFELRVKF